MGKMKFISMFRQRNFGLLIAADAVSVLGDEMGWMALLWFVMIMTKQSSDMGLLAFGFGLPGVVLGPVVGNILDKLPQKKVILLANLLLGGIFITIPIIYAVDSLSLTLLLILVVAAGCLTPFVTVGWMVMLPSVVSSKDLSAANSVNEILFQSALMFGPFVGGLLIASIGAPFAVLLDGLSFWIAALLIFPIKESGFEELPTQRMSFWTDLKNGFKYLFSMKAVWWITIGALFLNIAYGVLEVSLPLYVHHELMTSALIMGSLWMVYFIGSICGAIASGFINLPLRKGSTMAFMVVGWGVCFSSMIWFQSLWASFVVMIFAGFLFGGYPPIARTVVQNRVPSKYQGRVFGLRMSLMALGIPIGSYISGEVDTIMKPSVTMGFAGIGTLVLGLLLFLIRDFRKI